MNAHSELAKDFANYGNAITAFCLIQSVTFIYTLGSSKDFQAVISRSRQAVLRTALIWGIIYSVTIAVCFTCELTLRILASQPIEIAAFSAVAFIGRIVFVWFGQYGYRFAVGFEKNSKP